MTPEEKKQRLREATAKYRAKLTPEQKEKILEQQRERRANFTDEERQNHLQYRRKYNSQPKVKDQHRKHSRLHQRKLASTPEGREKLQKRKLLNKYGMTKEQLDLMFVNQGSCCVICKATEPGSKIGWHTDHCHRSNKVRGILCHGCNVLLGYAKDKPEVLRSAARYLIAHNTTQEQK